MPFKRTLFPLSLVRRRVSPRPKREQSFPPREGRTHHARHDACARRTRALFTPPAYHTFIILNVNHHRASESFSLRHTWVTHCSGPLNRLRPFDDMFVVARQRNGNCNERAFEIIFSPIRQKLLSFHLFPSPSVDITAQTEECVNAFRFRPGNIKNSLNQNERARARHCTRQYTHFLRLGVPRIPFGAMQRNTN